MNARPRTKSFHRGNQWLGVLVAWKHDVDLVKFPSADINGLWGSEFSDSDDPSENSGGKLHK
jgi:hypothetical protein